jgi:YidC/Oxa1 family membrane protein insertase
VSNYYFTCVLFPFGANGAPADFVEKGFADSYPDRQSLDELARSTHGRPFAELDPQTAAGLAPKAYRNVRAGFRSRQVKIPPGQTVVHEYGLYAGPRDRESLGPYAALSLDEVNRYGMLSPIVTFFIWLLSLLKSVALGSWGMAIVLLTLIVKLCLHPINKKSQASMHRFQKKMQAVKPEMDALKERYAQKPAQMQKEMQALFKKHGINPGQQAAGCLMIFLQMPIWIGLLTTLNYAIGLRQAGFLYIRDLTRAAGRTSSSASASASPSSASTSTCCLSSTSS